LLTGATTLTRPSEAREHFAAKMTTKGDYYAPPDAAYQAGGATYKDQDYEIIEAGLVPNINAGVGGSAEDLEKQLRLGTRAGQGGGAFAESLAFQLGFNISSRRKGLSS